MGSIHQAPLLVLCLAMTIPKMCLTMQCDAPEWPEELGPNPVAEQRGNVVLVAFLKGYCGYCIHQAGRLESLKASLASEGYADIAMVLINGGEQRSRDMVDYLINASSLPVLQDNENNTMYDDVFRAMKDDFIVYDRCGQLVMEIPFPYSNLQYPVTERILRRIHDGEHSCYCALDSLARRNNRYSQRRNGRGRGRGRRL